MGVSVIVVNWNAGAALGTCLDSIATQSGDGDVILVDNASTDGSTAAARRRHGGVRVIETGRNLGFAAGANRGADAARGELLVFVNPDAVLLPGALDGLTGALLAWPGAGIAGGGLRSAVGRWQPASARFGPIGHLLLDTWPGRLRSRWRRAPHVVDWVYGTFMVVRRDLFRQLGGFDPGFFVYGEDLDLCHRAQAVGARTIHVPEARAVHEGNVSAVQRWGAARATEVTKGEMRFYARRWPPSALRCFRVLGAAKFATKALLALAGGRPHAAASAWRVARVCIAFDPSAPTIEATS